ncbi:MAG: proline--tRNA ligase [Patescibacteria group bacterium]
MRISKLIPKTRRQAAEGLSGAHALLVRAGYIRQVERGLFVLAPLGFRVWRKLQDIIFAEMERDGVLNVNLPIIQPKELWDKTGRWDRYQASKTMLTTRNPNTGREFGLAPTAEEVVTWLAALEVQSYQDLPVIFHQIGWKFRAETRPHGGLLRGVEFDMSDAYSFDVDEAGMRKSFELFRTLYTRIFSRVGLRRCIAVQADSGAIGGKGSAEFMAISEEVGEDVLITCAACNYGANLERATSRYPRPEYSVPKVGRRGEHTPGTRTVVELEGLFKAEGITADRMVKTIVLTVTKGAETYNVAVCIRGDLEINLVKVRNALGADEVAAAEAETVREVTGAEVGFAGPLGLVEHGQVRDILFDQSTQGMTNFLCGLNETDYHALDVNFGSDELPVPTSFHDLHQTKAGHQCPECEAKLTESHGIEVGHIFMLQTGYAQKMGAQFRDAGGKMQDIWMGCYGIGVTRLLQTVVEQSRDKDGIIWPESIAPYQVIIVPVNAADTVQMNAAKALYRNFQENGVQVMLDDRDLRGGQKFADADLLGIPLRITVGRKASEGVVEFRRRSDGTVEEVPTSEAHMHYLGLLAK